ncbi:ParB/RepB/Spo0J family partition protein [Streptomyces sp. NPDC005408]|uniref:ParB/RepB/Spo0J family partition protein n=1 Tax=Streptomyces sp. NPDC005408 TaxID=3155341 RepID=UPI0033AC391A
MIAHQLVRVHEGSSSDSLLALRDKALHDAPVELVPLGDLLVSYTPRVAGVDGEYVLALAELEAELPPILVHRATMTVIDGLHRLRAAALKGRSRIRVRFFDGAEDDAALLSVAMNVAQGRPLSMADRTAAAGLIFASRPHWSDRAVATVAGLSAKKVSEIRLTAAGMLQCDRRVGLDGRARPLNSAHGRELAGRLIRDDPDASLRTIAKKAGISPATVADVRDRLLRGEDPVPPRQRGITAVERGPQGQAPRPAQPREPEAKSPGELFMIFDSLRRDPSLRLNEVGRNVLRMLDACSLVAKDRQTIIANLPPHCKGQMSELMNGYAELWRMFADELQGCEELQGRSW